MIKYKANLNIFSKEITAKNIENILNIKGDEKKEIGDKRINHKSCILKIEENIWTLKSKSDPSLPLSNHIRNLFKRIHPKLKNFSFIKDNCEVICQCIVEGNEEDGSPELNFPSDLIKDLSLINASLDIDIYIL